MFCIEINHPKIGLKSYKIRTEKEASNEGLKYIYWKKAREGEYAISDDGYVAKVIKTKGIATHMIHISGIIIESFPFKTKLSANKSAINVTISLPIIAEGTRLIFFADLIITAPTAKPVAQINPKKFPKRSPLSKESLKI